MQKKFVIADLHLGHANICKFHNLDGTKLRPWDNVDEMNSQLVYNWNNTVSSQDKVYCLGDVIFGKRNLSIFNQLNGVKILIKGNHDRFDLKDYLPYFKDIQACSVHKSKVILTHIPIHPESKTRYSGNIHGHLHNRVVMIDNYPDPWYYNVSVERINYTPILLDDVICEILK